MTSNNNGVGSRRRLGGGGGSGKGASGGRAPTSSSGAATAHHAAYREGYEKMWRGTAVNFVHYAGGDGDGGRGGQGEEEAPPSTTSTMELSFEDGFVGGLWGRMGAPAHDDHDHHDDDVVGNDRDDNGNAVHERLVERKSGGKSLHGNGKTKENANGTNVLPPLSAAVWKRRTGLGGKFAAATRKEWERRRMELVGTMLRYYAIDLDDMEEDEDRGKGAAAATENVTTNWEGEGKVADAAASERGASEPGSTMVPPSGPPPLPPPPPQALACGTPLTSRTRRTAPQSPSWVPHVSFGPGSEHDFSAPRGEIDLCEDEYTVEATTATQSSNPAVDCVGDGGAGHHHRHHLPTPHVLTVLRNGESHWKVCFDSARALDEWTDALRAAMGAGRIDVLAGGDGDGGGGESHHGFKPGDHVTRWEVLVIPVGYPIQIHGIVLEAGRNCVIIADFGLTSYAKKVKGGGGDAAYDVSTSDEDKTHQSAVMDQWKKLRPKQLQRLNVIAYTDEKEIRKWKKVSYGEGDEVIPKGGRRKKLGKNLSSLFRTKSGDDGDAKGKIGSPKLGGRKNAAAASGTMTGGGAHETIDLPQDGIGRSEECIEEDGSDGGAGAVAEVSERQRLWQWQEGANDGSEIGVAEPARDGGAEQPDEERAASPGCALDEPSWFDGRRADASSRPRVFSLDLPPANGGERRPGLEDDRRKTGTTTTMTKGSADAPRLLPKSDPARIVLARTNFLLEFGDDVLPPYHVFHSNSECIAVWCKTGRWSTLQTSIFLASVSVGNAKSSAVMTMGVAAAHLFLLPVAAVGGIAAVTAPWIILKKSKEKWEAATMSLTDKFWTWAPPEVYVEAIEHWSNLR